MPGQSIFLFILIFIQSVYKKGIWTWEAGHPGVGKFILSLDFKELITTQCW